MKIETEHHKFLVANSFVEGEDELKKIIIEIDKTDEDEIALIIENKTYYVSLAQFLLSLKYSNIKCIGITI